MTDGRAELQYGTRPSRRWLRITAISLLMALGVAAGLSKVRPLLRAKYDAWRAAKEAKIRAAKEHKEQIRIESVVRAYTRPRGWLAFESGRAGNHLLSLDPGYLKLLPWDRSEEWPREFVNPVGFKPREQFALGWNADSATLFIGQRYAPDGTERLVFVCYLFQGQGRTAEEVKQYGFRLMFRGGTIVPTKQTDIWSRRTIGEQAYQVYVNLGYESRLRIYWAQPDPADRTRFHADYELNGTRGRIHWKLTRTALDIESADGPLEPEFRRDREASTPWRR